MYMNISKLKHIYFKKVKGPFWAKSAILGQNCHEKATAAAAEAEALITLYYIEKKSQKSRWQIYFDFYWPLYELVDLIDLSKNCAISLMRLNLNIISGV